MLYQLGDHVAENGAHRIESLVCRTNVAQANIVKENLLYNENGNGLAKLRSGFHDPKTERDDLGGQEEVDHIGRIILHQGADHTQRRQTEVLEGARLGCGIEERVKEKRDVS